MTFISDFEDNVALPALFTNLPTSGASGVGVVDSNNVTWMFTGGYDRATLIVITDDEWTLEEVEQIKILMQSLDEFSRIDKFGIVIIINLEITIDDPLGCIVE